MTEQLSLDEPIAVGSVFRKSAPRIVRDGLGPLACFFVGWKLVGLVAGIGLATLFGLVMYRIERGKGRPALIVRVALGLVLLRAVAGLISGSAKVYLGQEVLIDAVIGLILLESVRRGRPLAQLFGEEVYAFPDPVKESETYAHTFRVVTLAWASYFLVRSGVRLAAVLTLSVDHYLLVAAISDAPFLLAMLAWSIFYTSRAFRRSEELGEAVAVAEARAAGGGLDPVGPRGDSYARLTPGLYRRPRWLAPTTSSAGRFAAAT